MADLRNLILANDEENAALVAALREADAVIIDLRLQVTAKQAEIDAMKDAGGNIQGQIDKLTLSAQERKLAIEKWVAQTLRQ